MRVCIGFILFMIICSGLSVAQADQSVHFHKHQFRGVWIATVRNLDWPSKPGLPVADMKAEYIQQLELLKDLGMNAVIVQVRPAGDAMYTSSYEPWSEYLTGKQGVAPGDGFDPLAFMIAETHKRCMEFHAWFNPFRGIRDVDNIELAENHIFHEHPDWFVRYGAHMYFNPGVASVRAFTSDVIMDVVRRYDIDAIHFDDYYYPYRIEGEEFPDQASFEQYGGHFYPHQKDDWGRDNINKFVRDLSEKIESVKPWVHFGISPFGVWRNKSQDSLGSDTETLQNNYDDLYGDALKWVEEGWLDYILPQCYQYLGRDIMDYRVVAKWWNKHHHQVNYYIGQGPFRLGNPERGEPWIEGNEIDRQLAFNDSISDLKGSAYFRSLTFFDNPLGVNDILKKKYYKYPALVPCAFSDRNRKNVTGIIDVSCRQNGDNIQVECLVDAPESIRWYVVYQSRDIKDPKQILAISHQNNFHFDKNQLPADYSKFYITSVDKYRIESAPVEVNIEK